MRLEGGRLEVAVGAEDTSAEGGQGSLGWDLLSAATGFVARGTRWPGQHGGGLASWAPVLQVSVALTMAAGWLIFGFEGTFERLIGATFGAVGVSGLVVGLVGAFGLEATLVPPPRPGVADPSTHPLLPAGTDKGAVAWHGLTVLQGPFEFAGVQIGVRMAVLPVGEAAVGDAVALWSPIEATPERIEAVRALGEVRWILAPNPAHHLFLAGWLEAFPEAKLIGVTGAQERRPELPWAEIWAPGEAATLGDGAVEVHVVPDGPAGTEMAVFHRASGALLLADLVLSIGHEPETGGGRSGWILRLGGMAGRPGPLLEWKLKGPGPQTAAALRAVGALPFERLLVAHGRPIELEAKQTFDDAFRFLTE